MRSSLLRSTPFLLQHPHPITSKSLRRFSSSTKTNNDNDDNVTPTQHLSPIRKYPRHHKRTALDEEELKWDLDDMEEEDERHMSSYGWDLHRQQREFFNLMRTLERDAKVLRGELRFSTGQL
jgi:hypothetical protein